MITPKPIAAQAVYFAEGGRGKSGAGKQLQKQGDDSMEKIKAYIREKINRKSGHAVLAGLVALSMIGTLISPAMAMNDADSTSSTSAAQEESGEDILSSTQAVTGEPDGDGDSSTSAVTDETDAESMFSNPSMTDESYADSVFSTPAVTGESNGDSESSTPNVPDESDGSSMASTDSVINDDSALSGEEPVAAISDDEAALASETSSKEEAGSITLGESKTIAVGANTIVTLSFVPTYTHEYAFYSSGSSDTYGYLYDADGKQLTYNDDGGEGRNFKVTCTLTAGQTYHWGARWYSSSNAGDMTVHLELGENHTYTENEQGELVCICGTVAPVSGVCGENLTWSFDRESGTLSITGSGAMTNYTGSNKTPWALYSDEIKAVSLDEGVTSIGNYAFYSCTALDEIVIPKNVASVGSYAFDGKSLTNIYLEAENVTFNASQASTQGSFSVTIAQSVKTLTADTLRILIKMGCSAVIFEKPQYLTAGSWQADFLPDQLNGLPQSEYFIDEQGVFYRIDSEAGTASVFYCPAGLTSCTVPKTLPAVDGKETVIPVTGVDSQAFSEASNLTALTFESPETIITLEDMAFYRAKNLETINGASTSEAVISLFTADELNAVAGGASNRSGEEGKSYEALFVECQKSVLNNEISVTEYASKCLERITAILWKYLNPERLEAWTGALLTDANSYETYMYLGNRFNLYVLAGFKEYVRVSNLEDNSQMAAFSEYALNQTNGPASNLKFGLRTMSYNGCGIMATYNILKYLSENNGGLEEVSCLWTDIRDIGNYLFANGSILFGEFGYFPESICNYLNEKLEDTMYWADIISGITANNYDREFQNCKLGILYYWNNPENPFEQTHYIMIEKQQEDMLLHQIKTYNYAGGEYNFFDSISNLLMNVDGTLKHRPICLIRIRQPYITES